MNDKMMQYWNQYKMDKTTPLYVLNDIKNDIENAIEACKKGNEEELLKYIYDIHCDTKYFMKDFDTTPEEMEQKSKE